MMGGNENYAEKCADFIFAKLGSYQNIKNVTNGNITVAFFDDNGKVKADSKRKGLYMFFARFTGSAKGEERYPLYIGKTDQTFQERFYDHSVPKRHKSGLIKKMFPEAYSHLEYSLGVVMLPLTLCAFSKFTESLFLTAFDFALNEMENSEKRNNISDLDQTPSETIQKKYFNPVLEAMENFTGTFAALK